jgi:hypothetical protein
MSQRKWKDIAADDDFALLGLLVGMALVALLMFWILT